MNQRNTQTYDKNRSGAMGAGRIPAMVAAGGEVESGGSDADESITSIADLVMNRHIRNRLYGVVGGRPEQSRLLPDVKRLLCVMQCSSCRIPVSSANIQDSASIQHSTSNI